MQILSQKFFKEFIFCWNMKKKEKTEYYSKTTMVHITNYMDHRYHILEFSLKETEIGH